MALTAFDDPAVLAETAAVWRQIRARRLAREAAHEAGNHDLCEPRHGCAVALKEAS